MWEKVSQFIIDLNLSENLIDFLNSNFTAALAGALLGALVAQYVGDKAKRRNEMIAELRAISSSKILAFNMCLQLLTFKSNDLSNEFAQYHQLKSVYQKFLDNGSKHNEVVSVPLPNLVVPTISLDELKNITLNNITLKPRAISTIFQISDCYQYLTNAVVRREKFLEEIHSKLLDEDEDINNLVFGFPTSQGFINVTLPSTTEAIVDTVDHLIFFSSLIIQDLDAHEDLLIKKYKSIGGGVYLKVKNIDFSNLIWLFPKITPFEEWLKHFPDEKSPKYYKK